jgi:hypothetical protein
MSARAPARTSAARATDLLLINGEHTASMVLSRCRQTTGGLLRWLVRLDRTLVPDITILVRMDALNQGPADHRWPSAETRRALYFVVPK